MPKIIGSQLKSSPGCNLTSQASSATQRVADPSTSPWPGKEQPWDVLAMDKEHFHLPYLLGQAVQHQGPSQDGALGVGKGLVCIGWQSVVGSWMET